MTTGVISAAINAGPIHVTGSGLVHMAGSLWIHNMNPETARQWIDALTPIAEKSNA